MTPALTREQRAKANPPQLPHPRDPAYVHACHHGEWLMHFRYKTGPKVGASAPYTCGSRRHLGPCRDRWSRILFARLADPACQFTTAHKTGAAMLWTLTLPGAMHANTSEHSLLALNEALGDRLRRLFNRLNKQAKRDGRPVLAYFWVREAHRSGVPHVHLLVVDKHEADQLRDRDQLHEARPDVAANGAAKLATGSLLAAALASGFGERFEAELVKDREAVVGYMTKVVGSMGDEERAKRARYEDRALAGEVTKGTQVPELLPVHCRSYGSSRGFIPPRNKDDNVTAFIETDGGILRAKKTEVSVVAAYTDADGHRTLRPRAGGGEGLVFEASETGRNVRFESQAEAFAYLGGGFKAPVRRYTLGMPQRYRGPGTIPESFTDWRVQLAKQRAAASAIPLEAGPPSGLSDPD